MRSEKVAPDNPRIGIGALRRPVRPAKHLDHPLDRVARRSPDLVHEPPVVDHLLVVVDDLVAVLLIPVQGCEERVLERFVVEPCPFPPRLIRVCVQRPQETEPHLQREFHLLVVPHPLSLGGLDILPTRVWQRVVQADPPHPVPLRHAQKRRLQRDVAPHAGVCERHILTRRRHDPPDHLLNQILAVR